MSAEGIAEFVRWHEEVRAQLSWLARPHVTDDADPAVIAAATGGTSGAIAAGPCRVGSPIHASRTAASTKDEY